MTGSPRSTPAALLVVLILALGAVLASCSDEQATTSAADETDPPAGGRDTGPGAREAPERPPLRRATLTFSGDILIHEPVWQRALAYGGGEDYAFEPLFAPLRPWVARADASICLLETPLTSGPPQGYPVFSTPPELADAVAAGGWDACSTASNHSLDQGIEGIAATGRILDAAGIEHTGTSAVPGRRSPPAVLRAGGMRIALLSYTTDTNGLPLAGAASVNLAERERIVADAERARDSGADAVVVNIHWGSGLVPEYVTEPNGAQRELVDGLLDSGAITAVVGQGPHVVQPVELRGGRGVVFSSGNLVSNQGADSGLDAASQDGIIVTLALAARGDHPARVTRARYLPLYVTRPDYVVQPVGRALARGRLDEATARASYERTVGAVGSPPGVEPQPRRLGG